MAPARSPGGWRCALNLPASPTNGRAMTRPTPRPVPTSSKAISTEAIQLVDRDDFLVRGNLEHAVGGRVDDRLAARHVLPPELVDDRGAGGRLVAERAAADARLRRPASGRPEIRSGNVGKGRSSTSPMSSQCPVTESLPGEASAMRPNAPSGSTGPDAGTLLTRCSPRRRNVGTCSPIARAMCPSVSLPRSP